MGIHQTHPLNQILLPRGEDFWWYRRACAGLGFFRKWTQNYWPGAASNSLFMRIFILGSLLPLLLGQKLYHLWELTATIYFSCMCVSEYFIYPTGNTWPWRVRVCKEWCRQNFMSLHTCAKSQEACKSWWFIYCLALDTLWIYLFGVFLI